MVYKLGEKEIKISKDEIERIMKGLKVSEEEAIQIYLEDEGYLENNEQEELCKKAKENRVTATIHKARAEVSNKKREYVRKENPAKEKIIAAMAKFLQEQEDLVDIKIINIGKIIEFNDKEGNSFKLDLIQKRNK